MSALTISSTTRESRNKAEGFICKKNVCTYAQHKSLSTATFFLFFLLRGVFGEVSMNEKWGMKQNEDDEGRRLYVDVCAAVDSIKL